MKHAIILICLVFNLNADAQSQAERPNITLIMADDTTGDTMPKALGQTGKPNVVLIYSDDQGWGDVGYHGYNDIMTPNIDRLATHGTQFSQGYVCASVCGPSRAGLLTGVYQQRMGVYGNYDKGGVPTSQPMIFEMLKKQGYQTAAIGKWHVGAARDELRPNNRGVDFFYGFLWGAHDYSRSSIDPEDLRKSERPIYRNTRIEPPIQDANGYLTEMFTREAVGFIEQASNEPFFLYLAYNAVHHPWDVPKSYIDRVQGLDTHEERKLFAGMVLAMDDGVGAVMDALKKKGLDKDTLVIFLSDNGSPRGQGIAQPRQKTRGTTTMSSPGPFNGFKGDTYEGGIRVPFVMHWPGRIPADKTYSHPVINLDLAATIMARMGISSPGKGVEFDGVDLMPFINGEKQGRPHDVLYWRRGDDYAIRKGDWKLAWNDQAGPQTIRLFNMLDDPGEWRDLSGRLPARAQTLQDIFDRWDSQLPDNQSPRHPRNRNTGYAEGDRVSVAEFNARIMKPESAITARRAMDPRGPGRTLAEQLTLARANAKKNGKRFDAARTTRWFRAKDLNQDGVLDAREIKNKAPVGWNTVR
jgi:arylsulfatase A-like enzyme